MKRISVALMGVVFALGCASAKVAVNPAAQYPVQVSEQAPAFLFPVNLSHLGSGGDPNQMGVTVTAGVAAHFGKSVVSGQQLFDQVGNLSYELAESIQSQVNANQWEMNGSAEPIATQLSGVMTKVIDGLVTAHLLDKPIKFKYIIAVHSHGEPALGGASLQVTSWGGLYDAETKQIVSYISSTDTYANKPEAVMAQLPNAYNGIITKLLGESKQGSGGH